MITLIQRMITPSPIPKPPFLPCSVASTALYFYDYAFGFTVLLALSLVHVVLEFPLNSLAFRQLGAAVGRGFAQHLHRQA